MSYATADASQRQPGDRIEIGARALRVAEGVFYDRDATQIMASPGAPTITLPAELVIEPPTVDRATDPRVTLRIPNLPPVHGVVDYLATVYTHPSITATQMKFFQMSASWVASQADSIEVTTPDLSSFAGWTPAMAIDPTQPVNWSVQRDDHDASDLRSDGHNRSVSSVTSSVAPTP